MFIPSICGDNLHDGTRTILKQLTLKLCKNLRTTKLGQNLLVLIKKKGVYHRGHSWLLSFSYSLSMILRQTSILKCAFLQTIVLYMYTELSPPASEFPAESGFFFICYVPHENKVVMNCKFKKNTICRVFGVLSSKHIFLLASLLTLGPVVWQFVVVVTVYISQT